MDATRRKQLRDGVQGMYDFGYIYLQTMGYDEIQREFSKHLEMSQSERDEEIEFIKSIVRKLNVPRFTMRSY